MLTASNQKSLQEFLLTESERIQDLLLTFNVPNTVEDDICDEFLLHNDKTVNAVVSNNPAQGVDDLEERLNTIRNKIKQKKRPMSERTKKKREAKKLKNNKKVKKVLTSVANAMKKNAEKLRHTDEELKVDKKDIKPSSVFNEESKIVFSKFDFASHPGAKIKKSHHNTKELFKKINETNRKFLTLKEQGEEAKATELINDLNWQKAFDKTEGKKVKDDPKLLVKALKKRKVEKKKSKEQWNVRKQKVELDLSQRQKKRNENLNKRVKDKKIKKFKSMAKKGRIAPGF